MAEASNRSPNALLEQGGAPKLNLAKLRALARPGFDPHAFVRSFSTAEIVALAGLIFLIVAAILVYSFGILPDQVARVQAENEVAANEAKKTELQQQVDDPTTIRDQYVRVRDSLEAFRGNMLKPRLAGRLEIIDAVDRISRETGVRLTSPVAFTTAMPTGPSERRPEDESAIRSFPALSLSFSISGQYEQVRNFISRFEASRQFVVIDQVSIGIESGQDVEGGGMRRAQANAPGLVDLQISMTAYFQPDAALEPAR